MSHAWRGFFGIPFLLGGLATAPAAPAQQTVYLPAPPVALAPRMEGVETRPAAERLVGEGVLVKSWFFPRELGGAEDPENVAYITPQAVKARAALIRKLERLMARDLIDQLDVQAEYKGESVIPSRIRYKAWHSRGGDPFEWVVEVW